jgi:hypothetical protein
MNEWHSAKVLPPFGTTVITYCATTSFPHQRYDLMIYSGRWRPLYGGMANQPTHWQFVPEPPETK